MWDRYGERIADGKRKVTIYMFRKRLLDKDNAYTSVKYVLDALTYWGLIIDDKDKYCDLTVEQAKSSTTYTKIFVY